MTKTSKNQKRAVELSTMTNQELIELRIRGEVIIQEIHNEDRVTMFSKPTLDYYEKDQVLVLEEIALRNEDWMICDDIPWE